ncbi:Hypothetical predicted protein [Pelobates cultripes]|uniref:Uncharacterized protein n=1 Tax=Pelobates cultripes TaxID=61616 RepID=A0AAD1RSE2_PELCU|nr:Hypothetical predicted protein [Pelobates cultripes]CAH2276250.1 Hypothetical predicted protein [Pelobates cultripes]
MTLVSLLEENNETATHRHTDLKSKSRFTPNIGSFRNIELFLEAVTFEIDNIKTVDLQFYPNMNLTKHENKALQSLRKDNRIIIKPADKGGNIVVMNSANYVEMTHKILEDRDTYHILKSDPTNVFLNEYKQILDMGCSRGLLSQDEYEFILNRNPRIATFYCLTKIHEDLQNPTRRPIVSGADSLTQNGSIYTDRILRPYVESLPSFIQDSKQTLALLSDLNVPESAALCSLDVEFLYSSIPLEGAIQHVQFYLEKRGTDYQSQSSLILNLLEFILLHNYFLFNNKFYHQV